MIETFIATHSGSEWWNSHVIDGWRFWFALLPSPHRRWCSITGPTISPPRSNPCFSGRPIQIKELFYDSDEARNRLLLSEQPPALDVVVVDYLTLQHNTWASLFLQKMRQVTATKNTQIRNIARHAVPARPHISGAPSELLTARAKLNSPSRAGATCWNQNPDYRVISWWLMMRWIWSPLP